MNEYLYKSRYENVVTVPFLERIFDETLSDSKVKI